MRTLDFKAAWSVTEGGEVEGLASVFGTADRGGDVVHKGAFASATFPLPMLDAHDPSAPIGVWESGEETPEGLRVKGRLILSVERAREVRDLILSKSIAGLSIGYRALKKAARVGGGRDLFAVELVEISVTAVPMHPGARIISAKGAQLEVGRMDGDDDDKSTGEPEKKAVGNDPLAAVGALVAAALKPVAERLDRIEAKTQRAGGGSPGADEVTVERKAFRAYLQRGDRAADETKGFVASTDPQGGYLALPEFSGEVLRDIVELSPIRSLSSVRGTNAPSVIYPTRKPFGNATWDDDQDDETESAAASVFGSLEVVTKGMSTYVDIHNNLLADAPAVEAEVRSALAEDFEKKETTAFTNGNGLTQPEGFMTHAAIASYNNGHATVLQADGLIKFLYSITPSYRNKGVWMMNGATLGLLRTIKDTTNNYLWQPSLQAGQPETILGRPVIENIDMPDVAANAFPIIYGDFSGYRILDRLALSVLVDPYTRAVQKQTRYHSGRRVGGRVIMAAKFKKLKMAV